jgi:hypothetical protein
MNPTLRLILQIFYFVAFVATAIVAFAYHAMPWDALLGCFALMGACMFAGWYLMETPRPTKQCLAVWVIPVGLCADLQSMWHALAGHPQPPLPIGTISIGFVFLGLGLAISTFLSPRRASVSR